MGKASREANNSKVIFDVGIPIVAITFGPARKGRLTQTRMRALRTSSVLEMTQKTLAINL
jgi:hypothetical protein